jgi:flagellar hook-associated protein 1 FlgK
MASNTLQLQQIGLQVTGQNMANASTPGYSREVVNFVPGPTEKIGGVLLGTGATISSVQQSVSQFLNQRVRTALSDQTGSDLSTQTYQQLESIFGALNSPNLSSVMTDFSSAIAQVLNSPQDPATRNLAVLKGQTLTTTINGLAAQANQLRSNLNDQVVSDATQINGFLNQIGKLNVQISEAEAGGTSQNQAVGLLDQRDEALSSLSKLMNITTQNQANGSVTVYSGGDYLVSDGEVRQVQVDKSTDRGMTIANVRLAGSDAQLPITSGEVGGLTNSRDTILGGFLDQLNSFAGTLASEFNKVYSTGQGLNGYSQVASVNKVDDPFTALDSAGLKVAPVNGTFQVQVYDTNTGLTQTTNIQISQNGLNSDTTLSSLTAQLNGINGLNASYTPDGQLKISTTSPNLQVAFAGDTSGTLAALGVNTFFTGFDASSIAVNPIVTADPSTFAASGSGVGADTNVAQRLAQFTTQPLAAQNGLSINDLYDNLSANLTQGSNVAKGLSDSADTFASSLNAQQQAISGVSIDQETINMLQYERSYQASAKFISTISDLLNTLVQL